MLPVNIGGHTAYQNTFVSEFLKLYPDPFAVPKSTWDTIVKFWYLDLSETDTILAHFYPLSGKPVIRYTRDVVLLPTVQRTDLINLLQLIPSCGRLQE